MYKLIKRRILQREQFYLLEEFGFTSIQCVDCSHIDTNRREGKKSTKTLFFTLHHCQPSCPLQRRDAFGQYVCVEEVYFDSTVIFLDIKFTALSLHLNKVKWTEQTPSVTVCHNLKFSSQYSTEQQGLAKCCLDHNSTKCQTKLTTEVIGDP